MSPSRAPGLQRDVADEEHAAGVAVPAVEDRGHVDIDDVAILERLVAGNAMADDMVDRGAAALGVAAIAERGRHRAFAQHMLADQVVEFAGGYPGDNVRHQGIEDFPSQPAGLAHAGEAVRTVQLYDAIASLDTVVRANGHIFGHGDYVAPPP
jgi:hypothetical protein